MTRKDMMQTHGQQRNTQTPKLGPLNKKVVEHVEHLPCCYTSQTTPSDLAKNSSSPMVKPTNVGVLGLLAGRNGPSEGAMGHLALVLGVRYPSRTSPMPTGILKFQIRLFHALKQEVDIACCCGFWSIIPSLDRKGQ